VEKVLYDETVRKELIAKGYERAKVFSWEKTARETKKIYESLL
jgi:glycosyltransferase involved in cell wall biosynthesis